MKIIWIWREKIDIEVKTRQNTENKQTWIWRENEKLKMMENLAKVLKINKLFNLKGKIRIVGKTRQKAENPENK